MGVIDLNDAGDQRDWEGVKRALLGSAATWVPRIFPHGRRGDSGEWRMADISGRAPSKKGSFVIDLSAREPDKFAYEFDPTELRAYDPIGLLRDHFKIAGRALYERCAEISDKWGGLTILPPSGEPSISPHDAAVEKSEATAREIEFILAHCESSLAGTLAETYYRARGLETPLCDNVLFHPSLAPWPGASRGYPAIVARVLTPEGHETGGIHRTFLKDDGSHHIGGDQPNGPRAEAKMMLGPIPKPASCLSAKARKAHFPRNASITTKPAGWFRPGP
jgi:hypothetical protein